MLYMHTNIYFFFKIRPVTTTKCAFQDIEAGKYCAKRCDWIPLYTVHKHKLSELNSKCTKPYLKKHTHTHELDITQENIVNLMKR